MDDFSDAKLVQMYMDQYPGKSVDDAFDALKRLKAGIAAQQRRFDEETPQGLSNVLNNMDGLGINLQARGQVLDQNFDQAQRAEVLKDAALGRDQARMMTGGDIVKDLKQTETADLNSILGQMETDSKRRNTRGMIKNILGGAALLF
jgi:hypothetical protein